MKTENNFKLIAIRPLIGCDEKYSKILDLGEFYTFYSDYDLDAKIVNGKEEIEIKYTPSISKDLYHITRANNYPLYVNISAIVGKNGTGKSTLIELFFLVVYLVSLEDKKINLPNDEKDKTELEKIKNGLKVEIYYSLGASIHCLRFNNSNNIEFDILKTDDISEIRLYRLNQILGIKVELDNFFYSVAINYSIHGLNSSIIGNWVKKLFHKNDGYQTPVVINPMRNKGNFDINEENYFAKTRLFSNLLTPNKLEGNPHHLLTENQKVTTFRFILQEKKIEFAISRNREDVKSEDVTFETIYDNNDKSTLLKSIYTILFDFEFSEETSENIFSDVKYHEETIKYIIKKLIKIVRTYNDYSVYFSTHLTKINNKETKEYPYVFIDFEDYLKKIKKDNTHITFKLNQAINYLKNDILKEDLSKNIAWKKNTSNKEIFEISIEDLSDRIEKITDNISEIINNIPPSLFNIDLILAGANVEDKKNSTSNFNDLSSGEQQLIHSIQSVLYHLINVNSVFNQPKEKAGDKKRNTYQYVNVILDEVELYFHPEYQRNFISFFLTSLGRISVPNITAINILFSTHSPFILSDIPISNILRLTKQGINKPKVNEQTFGANIHDLLANDFFLEEGFMGLWAKKKIEEAIVFLNFEMLSKKKNDSENNIFSNIEIEEYIKLQLEIDKINFSGLKQDKIYYKNIIELIGEPIIKYKLQDMYNNIFAEELNEQIAREKINKIAKEAGINVNFNEI